jgi:hypothetical protein
MRKITVVATFAAALLAATASWADQMKIQVDAVDTAAGTISGASPEMKGDVRMFHYRDQTAGVKISELKAGDVVEVDYDGSSGTNWLINVTK